MELLGSLVKGQEYGSLEMRLAQYSKPQVLIIDELGYLPLEPQAGHLFFQLISPNRPSEEWDEVFGDQVVAAAILDRLLHHSHVVTIRGDSYRLREKRRSGLFRPQAGGSSSSGNGGKRRRQPRRLEDTQPEHPRQQERQTTPNSHEKRNS